MGVSTSMKLTRLFLFSTICMAALSPAFSATTIKMCLNPISRTTPYTVQSYYGGNYLWGKTLTSGGTFNISVMGIGMCFTSASQVKLGDSPNTIYCWCKTIRPEITDWGYIVRFNTNQECASKCPQTCATEYYVF